MAAKLADISNRGFHSFMSYAISVCFCFSFLPTYLFFNFSFFLFILFKSFLNPSKDSDIFFAFLRVICRSYSSLFFTPFHFRTILLRILLTKFRDRAKNYSIPTLFCYLKAVYRNSNVCMVDFVHMYVCVCVCAFISSFFLSFFFFLSYLLCFFFFFHITSFFSPTITFWFFASFTFSRVIFVNQSIYQSIYQSINIYIYIYIYIYANWFIRFFYRQIHLFKIFCIFSYRFL